MRTIFLIIFTFILFNVCSQTRLLHGRVFADGKPLPGVNVVIKQTTNGTVTDIDGKFSIEIPSDRKVTLVFSFMGPYVERIVKRNEDNIKINIRHDLGYHALYGLSALSLSKLSKNGETNLGVGLSIGYRYFYYRFGLGGELSFLQNQVSNAEMNFNQLGIPIIGYYRLSAKLKTYLGAGYYWTINESTVNNDFKVLAGLLYEKRRFGLGIRYLNGVLKVMDGQNGVGQNFQLTIQYRVR